MNRLNFKVKRLFVISLLGCLSCLGLQAKPTDGVRLTLSLHEATLKELFSAIEKQSDYTFVYDSSDIDTERKVSAV